MSDDDPGDRPEDDRQRGEDRSDGDDRAEDGDHAEGEDRPETLAERAARIRAELDSWETSEDAGDDVELADAVENIQRWTTGDPED